MINRLFNVLWLLAGLWAALVHYLVEEWLAAAILAVPPLFVVAVLTYIVWPGRYG